ncbi:hypothetical protein KAR29_12685 [Aminithiophilus ramosus]|uniref:Uncharacterized protein n=2 Tax=Synergistales TaxID=649776 RepID=A0A9Q7ANM2_9BACT|nr:hypothetical protein [Aminithiophilus ramosus]QTX32147.1 hypothetical protein KAR29_12685 [Aminithiophilus ramosus]QVL36015.1 hypothetical protein KIH16_12875 [Synergistota bacterium]
MSLLDALDEGWNLFCRRAADFWECGDHLTPNLSLMGLLQWRGDDEESPEETLERLCVAWERGDLVVRALDFPPLPVWVGATLHLMRAFDLPMALLRREEGDTLLLLRTAEGDRRLADPGPGVSHPWTRRCAFCPYGDICSVVYPPFID